MITEQRPSAFSRFGRFTWGYLNRPSTKHSFKQALSIFLTAFLGSLLTLWAGGKYIVTTVEGVETPNWGLMDELIVSAMIAGVVALLNWLLLKLQNGNGRALQEPIKVQVVEKDHAKNSE